MITASTVYHHDSDYVDTIVRDWLQTGPRHYVAPERVSRDLTWRADVSWISANTWRASVRVFRAPLSSTVISHRDVITSTKERAMGIAEYLMTLDYE